VSGRRESGVGPPAETGCVAYVLVCAPLGGQSGTLGALQRKKPPERL